MTSILDEAEKNLVAAFAKSGQTKHSGIKGDGRSKSLADFLEKRLPKTYGVAHKAEVVDYLDCRSGEVDIAIYDKVRNAPLSDDPIWLPVEALLGVIEVKSLLSEDELRKAFVSSQKISRLRPFKRSFTLNQERVDSKQNSPPPVVEATLVEKEPPPPLRCFRTVFAYDTNLTEGDWVMREWERVQAVTNELHCDPSLIDRILVLNRGMLNPPARQGADDTEFISVFHQWFIGLANFLIRENSRRPAVDWQTYHRKRVPGWKVLPDRVKAKQ